MRDTEGARCPYCDYLHDPSDDNFELYSEDCESDEFQCQSCDEMFNVKVYISYTWTTEKT